MKVNGFAVVAILSGVAGLARAQEEGPTLTIYSTAQPGAVPAELYQPAMQKAMGWGRQQMLQIPGYALVKDQRKVQIKQGRDVLRFTDVAELIEPTTVMFSSLSDPQGTTVLEQNFEFDLVSPEKVLDRFIDKPIGLTFVRPNGDVEEVRGFLLSHQGGQMILKTEDTKEPIKLIQQAAARVNLPELPGGLITRPTLVWNLSSKAGGEQLIRVSYETKAMTWWADYNLVFEENDKDANVGKLDLGAWVSILNQSGAGFPEARLKLIAGDVERAPTPQNPRNALAMRTRGGGMEMDAAAPQFEEKSFFEYHLYTLQRKTSLPQNSTKQIELFPAARGVPCERVYVYYGAPVNWGYGGAANTERELGIPMNKKVDVYLRFVNDEKSSLGMPLPAGRMRVNKLDPADKSLEFIGENVIDHTPKNEKVLVKLGSAFDVVGERRQTDFKLNTGRKELEESFEIKVRNHKDQTVKLLIKENLFRWSGWEVTAKSSDFEKADARTIHFPVTVEPNAEATVTYTVKYEW